MSVILEALSASGRSSAISVKGPAAALTYGELAERVLTLADSLRAAGVGPSHRIALAFPESVDAIIALLAVLDVCAAVPTGVRRTATELRAFFRLVGADAVLAPDTGDQLEDVVASGLGLPVFRWSMARRAASINAALPAPKRRPPVGTAVILTTSGSTGEPKIVPLTMTNLWSSIRGFARVLELSPDDVGVLAMPLSHIHGLVAGALVPVFTGGMLVVPGTQSTRAVADALSQTQATWYSSVPTFHRDLFASGTVNTPRLRLIRSASAPLSAQLESRIQESSGVPVLNSYGMTEAATLVTSNGLSRVERRPGSVGRPVVCELRVVDADGRESPMGVSGELEIRGPNVTPGYEAGPPLSPGAWLRTGDVGELDDEGFLRLQHRTRDVINRGGEKISPLEIDEALRSFPGVADAAAFATVDGRVGEEVAAAVQLEIGATVDEESLRDFVASRLSYQKVPKRIFFLDDLPRGESGKVQRHRLAAAVTSDAAAASDVQDDPQYPDVLSAVLDEFARFGHNRLGPNEDYFEHGGDSLAATELLLALAQRLGSPISIPGFFRQPTPAAVAAAAVRSLRAGVLASEDSSLVTLRPGLAEAPVFMLHGGGFSIHIYRRLASLLPTEQAIYGVQFGSWSQELQTGVTLPELARDYARDLMKLADGPYQLVGFSSGGLVAYEVARQITARGGSVALLALIDSYGARLMQQSSLRRRLLYQLRLFGALSLQRKASYVRERASRRTRELVLALGGWHRPGSVSPAQRRVRQAAEATDRAIRTYHPLPWEGEGVLFRARDQFGLFDDPLLGWDGVIEGGVRIVDVPGNHTSVMHEPNVGVLAKLLSAFLIGE